MANIDGLFESEECDRRMKEAMRRVASKPATMNMTTGQISKNLS